MKIVVVFMLAVAVICSIFVNPHTQWDPLAWLDGIDNVTEFNLLTRIKDAWAQDAVGIDPTAEDTPKWITKVMNSQFMEWTAGTVKKIFDTIKALADFLVWMFRNMDILLPWKYTKPCVPFTWTEVTV